MLVAGALTSEIAEADTRFQIRKCDRFAAIPKTINQWLEIHETDIWHVYLDESGALTEAHLVVLPCPVEAVSTFETSPNGDCLLVASAEGTIWFSNSVRCALRIVIWFSYSRASASLASNSIRLMRLSRYRGRARVTLAWAGTRFLRSVATRASRVSRPDAWRASSERNLARVAACSACWAKNFVRASVCTVAGSSAGKASKRSCKRAVRTSNSACWA